MLVKDRNLAMCELANDLFFHKIPEAQIPYYIDQSLAIGKDTAKRAKVHWAGKDLYQIYEECRIQIQFRTEGKMGFGVILRGQTEFGKRGCKVEVYQDSIRSLVNRSGKICRPMTYEQALQIHLAHEFFHYLEFKEEGVVAQRLEPVALMGFLGFKRTAGIQRSSEVAAHAFAKEFLGLLHLPNIYDYLYLIDHGKMTETTFEELLRTYDKRLSGYGQNTGVVTG